jgi:hypothetical protein
VAICWPLRTLDELEAAWLAKYDELCANPAINAKELAAPFLSVLPPKYDPLTPLVLYVGQATYGEWFREDFLMTRTVQERRNCTTKFLQDDACTYPSAFWRFGVDLSKRLAANADIQPLQNLVWTNISKIGRPSGNPRAELRRVQRELATETLSLEIVRYRPKLIVFATANYEDVVIDGAIGDPHRTSWHQERNADSIWWRAAKGAMPVMLWVYHPERKQLPLLEMWLQQACELFSANI